MPVDPNILLSEVACLNCNSNASLAQLLELAFLQRIDAAGGGGSGGGPSLPLNSVQFNNAGAFGGSADLTWQNTATVDLAIDARPNSTALNVIGYSLTGADAKSMLNLSGTWNTTGNPVALLLAIADTASGATAKFMEFLGGAGGATSLFSVSKAGMLVVPNITAGGAGGSSFSRLTVTSDFISLPSSIGAGVQFTAGPRISGITTENLLITNATLNGFGLLQFGGVAATFPALKRSTTILQARLADDSAYSDLWVKHLRLATAFTVATLPAAGVQGRMAYVTDALTPTFLTVAVGGGAVIAPVFDNGSTWVTV